MSAVARERLWTLVGRLLLEPAIGPLREVARQLPQLAPHLADVSEDELASLHHQAFSLGVPPFASVFLSDDAMLGGETTAAVHADLTGFGATLRHDVDADHFGVLALAMGFLSGAEADAERDGLAVVVGDMQAHQRRLHDRYLSPAVPAFAIALQRQGPGLYAEVASLLLALVPDAAGRTTEAPSPLDNPRTGLSAIARWLLTPRFAGWYLTRARIEVIARSANIPCGFGERYRMLEGLLKASVDHDQLEAVLSALIDEATSWTEQTELLSVRVPSLENTLQLLNMVRSEVEKRESPFTT